MDLINYCLQTSRGKRKPFFFEEEELVGLGLSWKLPLLILIQRLEMPDAKARAFCPLSKKKKKEREKERRFISLLGNKRTKLASKCYAFKHPSETTSVRPDLNKEGPFPN